MSESLGALAAWIALAWAGLLVWLTIGASLRRAVLERDAKAAREQASGVARGVSVLIIRPCAGVDEGLLDNLCSILAVDSQATLSLLMCADDPTDPAVAVIQQALPRLRAAGLDAQLEIHPPTGPNRKASLLAAALAGAQARAAELVVNVDSNVDLRDYDLDSLLAPLLTGARVGASWAPWVEVRSAAGLGPRASEAVLGGSLAAFPLLCGLDPGGLVGKLWAARREALEGIGGFAPLVDYLGEDFEMARRLGAAGWSVEVAPVLGRSRGGAGGFAKVVERLARWLLVLRGQRPLLLLTYPLFFFATPGILALAALGARARPLEALVAASMAVAARALITLAARYWSGRMGAGHYGGALLDAPLSDLSLALAWLRALASREVSWRGHRLRVARGGRLEALDAD
ncbi:hypothetical protein G6O69_07440 [Pseudenhygromyxa sp. WMMC2535]|uniref:glycosyltransferase n=1 Tax=Pseudenhygromyxa sp. WMMC2535 TaxID=2712867 RepID=UPI00155556E4|nr:glycosyltransferase [Pseudenhygromyxa sp. WMMC2535]NVB37661.1 hypothetical protein [Pseudenhygromyxa sp. WMMC2535]